LKCDAAIQSAAGRLRRIFQISKTRRHQDGGGKYQEKIKIEKALQAIFKSLAPSAPSFLKRAVIPAKAGIYTLDSRLRGNDFDLAGMANKKNDF